VSVKSRSPGGDKLSHVGQGHHCFHNSRTTPQHFRNKHPHYGPTRPAVRSGRPGNQRFRPLTHAGRLVPVIWVAIPSWGACVALRQSIASGETSGLWCV
jgi:hypothetical protein